MKRLASRVLPFLPRAGFTLMEVNLAIFIMAVGLLSMVAIYPLAYREGQQSKDDVKSAAAADSILNSLTAALSSRNIKWSDWVNKIGDAKQKTDKGWMSYCDDNDNSYTPKKKSEIRNTGKEVYGLLMGAAKEAQSDCPWPLENDDLACALVVDWGRLSIWGGGKKQPYHDHSRVAISLRVTRRAGELMAQPIYYTEIHFQGDQEEVSDK